MGGLRESRDRFLPFLTETPPKVTNVSAIFSQGGEQERQLVVDVGRIGDGLGDLVAHQLPVAAPQAMDGHLDRSLVQAQLRRRLGRERALLAPVK